MMLICNLVTLRPDTKTFQIRFSNFDEGPKIWDATRPYPNIHDSVIVKANSEEEAIQLFKARFPNSVIWDMQYA